MIRPGIICDAKPPTPIAPVCIMKPIGSGGWSLEHFSFRLNLSRSLPGLTRQSIFLRKWMDARVKPAHDAGERDAILSVNALSSSKGSLRIYEIRPLFLSNLYELERSYVCLREELLS